jgi:hypothetical protein
MDMNAISQTIGRLSEEGYTEQCRAEAGGVRFLDDGAIYQPEQVVVEEVVRFDGPSGPDEESVIFAVCSPDGRSRGTLCITYGAQMDEVDSDIMERLTVRPLH